MPVGEINLRVGGVYHYLWRNEDGREMCVGGNYLEIVPAWPRGELRPVRPDSGQDPGKLAE